MRIETGDHTIACPEYACYKVVPQVSQFLLLFNGGKQSCVLGINTPHYVWEECISKPISCNFIR